MSDSNDRESKTARKPAHRIARRQFSEGDRAGRRRVLLAARPCCAISRWRRPRTGRRFPSPAPSSSARAPWRRSSRPSNQSQGKILVKYDELPPPSASTEVHQGWCSAWPRRTGTPDVLTQDVVRIAEFAGAGWALPLDEYVSADEAGQYFPGVLAACRWNGKLTALPWFVDSGMLYYRTDLPEGHRRRRSRRRGPARRRRAGPG